MDYVEDKKRKIILTGLGIFTFVFLIIGATFAYFNIQESNDSSLEVTGNVATRDGIVTLSGDEKSESISISLQDMAELNEGVDYTYPEDTSSSTIATITASGPASEKVIYSCTVDVTVTNTLNNGTINEGDVEIVYGGDLLPFLIKDNARVLNDTNLVSTNGTLNGNITTTTTDEFIIISGQSRILTKQIILHNSTSSQNNLSGLDFTTDTEISNLNCQTLSERPSIEPVSLITNSVNDVRGEGGLSSSLTGDMYRYQGASTDTINNYICIGSDTCQTSTMTTDSYDDNTYRIIGITSDGRMKVIKMGLSNLGDYSSNTLRWYWNSTGKGTQYDWTNATVRTRLNNTNEGYYLASLGSYANYIDSSSNSKFYSTATIDVSSPVYMTTSDTTATAVYTAETGGNITSYSGEGYKVGLMQLSDYYLATSDSANCSSSGSYSTCKESWIHLSQNDIRYDYEWTSARRAGNYAWCVYSAGYASSNVYLTSSYGARPVFYLSSSIQLSGFGTKEYPYYITGLSS